MKISGLLLVICSFHLLAENSYSQTARLSIDLQQVTVNQVLSQIENQSEFYFLYNNKLIDVNRKVNIYADNQPIKDILDGLFASSDVEYIVMDRQIVLSPGEYLTGVKSKLQSLTVTGKVTDENGEPLPGAYITIKGTTKGTITNLEGGYTIEVEDQSAVLTFSFVGYKTSEIMVGNQTVIDVSMEMDILGLDDVIVIGYGTVKKSDLTGSVSSVKSDAISTQLVQNPLVALTGRTSGVQVLETSGEPGNTFDVRIRGSNSLIGGNSPLYVLDGFPITGNLDNLNPNDILSMEILKDASATAIYGSRGANGVILITTKTGTAGKTSVEYNVYYGVQKLTKRIDMLNAKEFATLANVRAANDGVAPFFSDAEIASFGEGTNWQDEIFRTGAIQNHSLSVSGGNVNTKFNVSANYFDHKGIIINSFYNRYQLKADLEHKINSNWKISVQNILSRTKKNDLLNDNSTRGEGISSGALDCPPTLPVYDEEGNYVDVRAYPFSPDVIQNPILLANEIKNQTTRNSDLLNLSIEGNFLNDFTFRSSLGIEYYDTRTDYYSSTLYNINYIGNARISYNDFTNLLNENTLTYFKEFRENHALTVLGGVTAQKTIYQNVTAGSTGYLTDIIENYNLASGSTISTPSSGYSDYSILSYLGRINYAYKGKYWVTASIRADGSSRFGENNKWGYFPSAALAWRVSEEGFWANINAVSNLKIRGSWGNTGNTAVSPYQSLSTLSSISVVFDDNTYSAFAPGTTKPNPDLKWETTAQWNAGMDIGVFNNRLSLTLDYYQKTTTDLLASVPLPTSSGYSTITSNIGSVENKGFEMTASYRLVQGSFNWDLGANISINRNKVLELSQGADVFGVSLPHPLNLPANIVREGYPMGAFYGYKEDGLTDEGLINYIDIDNSGDLNALDREIIGDPNPDYIFGINSFMSYKNFDLTFLITGVQGNDIFNFNTSNDADGFSFGINQIKDVLGNYWTVENPDPNAKYPRISVNTRYLLSDRFVEDGSYVKIQNVELSYTFAGGPFASLPFNGSQIYIGAQNLLTLTKYSWYSPEMNTRGADISKGIDQTGYPMTRTFMFGIRIKL